MIIASLIGVLFGEAWSLADDYAFQRDVRAGLYGLPGRPGIHHRERWWPFSANGVYFNGTFGAHD